METLGFLILPKLFLLLPEKRGPPIGGLDSLVVSLLYYNIFFTIILIAYVTNSVVAVSAEFLSLVLLNDFDLTFLKCHEINCTENSNLL